MKIYVVNRDDDAGDGHTEDGAFFLSLEEAQNYINSHIRFETLSHPYYERSEGEVYFTLLFTRIVIYDVGEDYYIDWELNKHPSPEYVSYYGKHFHFISDEHKEWKP